MKATLILLSTIGLCAVQGFSDELNLDQMLDEASYAMNLRSRRELCNPKPTSKPWIDPSCFSCNCFNRWPITVGRRALSSSLTGGVSTGGFFPNPINPPCYQRCCVNNIFKGATAGKAPAATVDSASLKSMASSFVNAFGKRADNSQFKKPNMDIVFLIDDSGSIPAAQFKVAKDGSATMADALCPRKFGGGKGTKQVATVLFSSTAKTIMTFEQSRSGRVADSILDMSQRSGATATADAIKHVRTNVLGHDGSRLNDPDTATVVLVLTDGKCNSGCNNLAAEAKKLRETGPGVQVFAFGIGEADCTELETIRGGDAGDVFGLPDYDLFEKLANAVKEEIAGNPDACM